MDLLRKIFKFYVFSDLHVSITAASLVVIGHIFFRFPLVDRYVYFTFFSTLLAYRFIRVFESCICSIPAVLETIRKQKITFKVLGFVAFFGTLLFGVSIGWKHIWILIPSGFLTLWYAIPIFHYRGKRISMRNYPTIKIVSIALVWATNTVLFPLQQALDDIRVWIFFMQIFLLIIALVIPFDIRDKNKDPAHLHTLPQRIGVAKAKSMGIILLLLFMVLGSWVYGYKSYAFFISIFMVGFSMYLLYHSEEDNSIYYTAFWVDAIPVLWLLLLLLGVE